MTEYKWTCIHVWEQITRRVPVQHFKIASNDHIEGSGWYLDDTSDSRSPKKKMFV